MTEEDNIPKYKHDCARCRFLGHHDNADLYYCPAEISGPTVIARFSDDGPNYQSGIYFAYGMNPLLTEARRRAVAQGLTSYDLVLAVRYRPPVLTQEDKAELQAAIEQSDVYKAVRACMDLDENERVQACKAYVMKRVQSQFPDPSAAPAEDVQFAMDDARKDLLHVFECARMLGMPSAPRQLAMSAFFANLEF